MAQSEIKASGSTQHKEVVAVNETAQVLLLGKCLINYYTVKTTPIDEICHVYQ